MAKVLITGIAGFIGSSLARGLLAQGASVYGVDDLSSGDFSNLEGIEREIGFMEASVMDLSDMSQVCRGVDYVFHQAAIPSVPMSERDPLHTNDVNLDGTLAVLEAARRAGVRRLIYASSAAAYGDGPMLKTETMRPEPTSPYAVQKLAGEYYLSTYARLYGLQTVALRYFDIFGPRQNPASAYAGALTGLIAQMCSGEAPTIFGDGSSSRDFTYIDNVVSANLRAAGAPSFVSGKVFNIASGQQTTMLQAYEAVRMILGYRGAVRFQPEREGEVRHLSADISLAKNLLGYRPNANLASGLRKTIAWAQSQLGVAAN